jgi:5-hydroxyisourate hydrolase
MKRISTHILDTNRGQPAADVPVQLEKHDSSRWISLHSSRTDPDGRCSQLLPGGELPAGIYRLVFDTAAYFASQHIEGLYPVVEITFRVREGDSHFHIPLLLSANGYITYRGS